jgi:hypothetical protein
MCTVIASKMARMKETQTLDLSSAYGDRDETLSVPAVILIMIYALTIGLVLVVAQIILLYAKSKLTLVSAKFQPRISSKISA